MKVGASPILHQKIKRLIGLVLAIFDEKKIEARARRTKGPSRIRPQPRISVKPDLLLKEDPAFFVGF